MQGFNLSRHSKICHTGCKFKGVSHHFLIVYYKVSSGSKIAVSSKAYRLRYGSIMRIYYVRHRVFKAFTTFAILCCRRYKITLSASRL